MIDDNTIKTEPKINSPLLPDEIREIRHRLDLTQAAAGQILGGGPRAFHKYETGIVRPSALATSLLRLLDEKPELLRHFGVPGCPGPFEVSVADITGLPRSDLPELFRRLLHCEAQAWQLPAPEIHVAENTSAPDGGEDGRIRWKGGVEQTRFLPSRFCQLQIKGGKVTLTATAREVLSRTGQLKPMVRAALDDGATYMLFCAQSYTQQAIEARHGAICESLRQHGMPITDDRIHFRDASQIATWVNAYPAVAVWVLQQTRPERVGPFRPWTHWRNRAEHFRSAWVADDRLPAVRDWCARAEKSKGVARIVGLAGIGKSRLVLEGLGDEQSTVTELVLYAVASSEPGNIIDTIQGLADSQLRAVVVVDECSPELHRTLGRIVRQQGSELSLITLDDEMTGSLGSETRPMDEAPDAVVGAILDRIQPRPYAMDRDRLMRFSQGFPEIAVNVASTWEDERRIPLTDDDLVDNFVLGRDIREREVRSRAAAVVAAFGHVGMHPSVAEQRRELASFARSVSEQDLYFGVRSLRERGVARRRGRFAVIEPRPIALRLAERQWGMEWDAERWDELLGGDTTTDLKIAAAKILALLNSSSVAKEVVSHVLRRGGPFADADRLLQPGPMRVLEKLAEIDERAVSECIDRGLVQVADLKSIRGDVRRSLVEVACRIAFSPVTFPEGARLLLRLAVAENETWANNATGSFESLFPSRLGNTAADGTARLKVLEVAGRTNNACQRALVVKALVAGTETEHFHRMMGAESRGALPSLQPWQPSTRQEEFDYVRSCAERLIEFAVGNDAVARTARSNLGKILRGLVRSGYIETVEQAVAAVSSEFDSWSEATESLGLVLANDSATAPLSIVKRVRSLLDRLQPRDLASRVREFVTAMPWHYPCDERLDLDEQQKRQNDIVGSIALEVAAQPQLRHTMLPSLSKGRQRKTFEFGDALAQRVAGPQEWLESILLALRAVPIDDQDPQLLAGFLCGLAKSNVMQARQAKRRVTDACEIRHHFVYICAAMGVESDDIEVVTAMLKSRDLPIHYLDHWTRGELQELPQSVLSPMLAELVQHSRDGYWMSIKMVYREERKQDEYLELGVPIRELLDGYVRWGPRGGHGQSMDDFYFGRVLGQILDGGRLDAEARNAALALATEFVRTQGPDLENASDSDRVWRQDGFSSLLRRLLSEFPDITWPLVGGAITSSKIVAWRMKFTLGTPTSIHRPEEPIILSLPEETLLAWCRAHRETAPAFACGVVPILATSSGQSGERTLHPLMRRLIDEFGDREDVQDAVISNLHHYTLWGSESTYFAAYIPAFQSLETHPDANIQRWAERCIRGLRKSVEEAKRRDEEEALELD